VNDAALPSGSEVPGVPRFAANADVEWDLPFAPGVTLTARAVHTGEQWVNSANTLQIDDWTRFDPGARCVFAAESTPVTLRLTVDNVTNERYWASAFDVLSATLLQGQPWTVQGDIFVLDRRTGRLITRAEERPVPQAGIEPAERSRTQPFSLFHTAAKSRALCVFVTGKCLLRRAATATQHRWYRPR
jgi:hypothetical protein